MTIEILNAVKPPVLGRSVPLYDPQRWIEAGEALSRLSKVMRSDPAAKDLLITALANGTLIASAGTTREEWDVGFIRREAAKGGKYVIAESKVFAPGISILDSRYFDRQPRGSRRWAKWNASWFAWIGPAGRVFREKTTKEFGRAAAKRFIMIDVVFLKSQYEALIDAQRTSSKRLASARTSGQESSWWSRHKWRTEKLPTYYQRAEAGTLEVDGFNLDRHGIKKQFAQDLMVHCGEDRSNGHRLRTYLRQVKILRDLNRLNRKHDAFSDGIQTDNSLSVDD